MISDIDCNSFWNKLTRHQINTYRLMFENTVLGRKIRRYPSLELIKTEIP